MLCKKWMLGLEIEADNIKEIGIAKERSDGHYGTEPSRGRVEGSNTVRLIFIVKLS